MQNPKVSVIKKGWVRALLFFLTIVLIGYLVSYLLFGENPLDTGTSKPILSLPFFSLLEGYFLFSDLLYIIAFIIFLKMLDRDSLRSAGLFWNGNAAITGMLFSIALLGIGTTILYLAGKLVWTGPESPFYELYPIMLVLFIAAAAEEIVFRGYILSRLKESVNSVWAIFISAAGFTVMHATNPDIDWMPLVNIFLGGIFFGIGCQYYGGNLCFPILFHFGWNFIQGPVLGYKVSGIVLPSLLGQDLSGNALLTGGGFGLEGSILTALLFLSASAILGYHGKRTIFQKENAVAPR
ncbi:MAG TPA: type II CAAX endopeptidase family protein [Flavitalea sp.]|nr:type II CAAX endopeptidase family protein [Flavitalea sp.]